MYKLIFILIAFLITGPAQAATNDTSTQNEEKLHSLIEQLLNETGPATAPEIVRAEIAADSTYLEVYFDHPAYRFNHSSCAQFTKIPQIYELCQLDSSSLEIFVGKGKKTTPINTVEDTYYTDSNNLSHVTLFLSQPLDLKKKYFIQFTNPNGEEAQTPFPIKVYKKNNKTLVIKTLTLGLSNTSTTVAKVGDMIEARIKTNKPLWGMGFTARASALDSDQTWTLSVTKLSDTEYAGYLPVTSDMPDGALSFEFYNFADMWSNGPVIKNNPPVITKTTGGSYITIKK